MLGHNLLVIVPSRKDNHTTSEIMEGYCRAYKMHRRMSHLYCVLACCCEMLLDYVYIRYLIGISYVYVSHNHTKHLAIILYY